MHQQRIEVVEIAPRLQEAGGERRKLGVAAEEGLAERAEQRAERQLDLGVRPVNCRIDEAGHAPGLHEHVAAPAIAVDQRRTRRLLDPAVEAARQGFDAREQAGRQPPGRVRGAGAVQQPVLAEEVEPARRRRIGLVERADRRVAHEAEMRPLDRVQRRQQFGAMRLGARVRRIARVDVVEQQ